MATECKHGCIIIAEKSGNSILENPEHSNVYLLYALYGPLFQSDSSVIMDYNKVTINDRIVI